MQRWMICALGYRALGGLKPSVLTTGVRACPWGTPGSWPSTGLRATTGDRGKRRSTGSTSTSLKSTDLDIHFIHQRSPHADAFPLLITHGWPGSIVEFHKVIEPLVNPRTGRPGDAFHVICPALPGYGFSGKPTTTGWGVEKIAQAWETLVTRLGYDRYGAQGGDWGAAVTTQIGRNGGRCVAIHLNMPLAMPPKNLGDDLSDREQRALAALAKHRRWGTGLFQAAVHPAANGRVRVGRFPGRTAGLDRREVLGMDGLRRSSGKCAQPR